MRWNSRSVYWWDPAEAGDYCNYDELFAYSNACVDLVPNNKNAKVELTK